MTAAFSCHRHHGRLRLIVTVVFAVSAMVWLSWWLGAFGAALTVALLHRDLRAQLLRRGSPKPLAFDPAALRQAVLWQWVVCLTLPRAERPWPQWLLVYRDEVSALSWARLRRQLVSGAVQPVGLRNSS